MAAKSTPKSRATTPAKKPAHVGGLEVPAHGNGRIWRGPAANHVAGTGRPPDAIRAAMRELGVNKGLPFLSGVLDGDIPVRFVGTCPHCKHFQPLPEGNDLDTLVDAVGDQVKASVDQRLRASEQAWKYGLGTQSEPDFASHPEFQRRMAILRRALAETCGEEAALAVIERAEAMLAGGE